MALQDDLITKFPELTDDINTYYDLLVDTYPCLYGATYGDSDCDDQAILYLMAHLISLQSTGKSGNFATSKSDEGVSISYATPTTMTEQYLFYSSTKYGVMFLRLTSKNSGAYFV